MKFDSLEDAQAFLGETYGITENQVVVDMSDKSQELDPCVDPIELWMTPESYARYEALRAWLHDPDPDAQMPDLR